MLDPGTVYARLLARYGPQRWWPADTRFEVIVGALLMAQTSWPRVEEAIENLRRAGALDPVALAGMPIGRLRALVRPAGLHRTKPRRLRAFCRHIVRATGGDVDRFLDRPAPDLRRELLALDGVGPETADSILLYAAGAATFVVDAYTVRIGRRLGLFATDRYEAVKAYFESRVPPDPAVYREYHALLVALGKDACRPAPRCDACPLRDGCPHPQRSYRGKNRTKE